MSGENTALAYGIATTVLDGVLIVPLGAIWVISFCAVRNRNDPARRPFTWMKVAYPLLTLYLVFNVASLITWDVEIGPLFDGFENYLTLDQIQTRLLDVANLIENIAHIFIVFCLVDLGLSFLYVLNNSQKGHNIIRAVVAAFGFILFAIDLAFFGKIESLRTQYYNAVADPYYDYSLFFYYPYYMFQLGASFDILLWLLSVAIFAFSIYVLVVSLQNPQLRSNAVVYLVIGILYLLRNTWILAYDAKYTLPKNPQFIPIYTEVLWPILDVWVTFTVLVAVFAIGCRKRHGLWTTEPPSSGIFGRRRQQQAPVQQWQAQPQVVQQAQPVQYVQQSYPHVQK